MKEFLGKLVTKKVRVKTEAGDFNGRLIGYDKSHHGGFGSLILDSQQGPVLILRWIAIGW